jgi:hypothetical protein
MTGSNPGIQGARAPEIARDTRSGARGLCSEHGSAPATVIDSSGAEAELNTLTGTGETTASEPMSKRRRGV